LLANYLSEKLSLLTLANFLRWNVKYQKYFQFCCEGCRGGEKYAKAEVLYHYEHGTALRIADDTFEKLIDEIGDQDVLTYRLPDRMCCQQLVQFCQYENLDVRNENDWPAIKKYLAPFVPHIDEFLRDLTDFLHVEAKLPPPDKNYINNEAVRLNADMEREEIIEYLRSMRGRNVSADLAFYAYRDMETCDWTPFIKAAIERSPVSIEKTKSLNIDQVYQWLNSIPAESIYSGRRLAQPDELANYQTGDGLEKAFLLANVLHSKYPQQEIQILVEGRSVTVRGSGEYGFKSEKQLARLVLVAPDGRIETSR
jgi:hypothetical protein